MHHFTRIVAATVALLSTVNAVAQADALLDRIASEILASKFGVSVTEITRLQKMSGLSIDGIAPVLSASSCGNTTPERVWALRRQGLGWGEIADRIGMHPGTFNKLRAAGAFDSPSIWNNALRLRFEVSGREIQAAQRRGATPQDMIGAILIGKATGRSMQAVLDEHEDVRDWESIRSKHGVDFGKWQSFAKKPSPKASSAGKSQAKDAKAKSKSKSKGGNRGKGG